MNITYQHIENNTLQTGDENIPSGEWFKENSWVNIYSDDRKAAADFLEEHTLDKECREYIEHPENYPLSQSFGETTILGIVMSDTDNIYKPVYIIVILVGKTAISIVPETSQIFKKITSAEYPEMIFSDILNHMYNILAADLLVHSNINMGIARLHIHQTEEMLVNDPDNLSSSGVMKLGRDISQLADIIEDQFIGFRIFESMYSDNSSNKKLSRNKEIAQSFDPLNKSMSRLEEKAESLRLQYALIQQEKSTRKINFLTIIQAVFVPLTFFAGIYGMNFSNMPELNLKYGYLGYWILIILLAAGMLSFFYKNGWFK
jgi:magnesium transporter